jgi:hypothetical protein
MGLAEIYINRAYSPDPTHATQRWWVNPDILVGGSIYDASDWNHLYKDFGVRSVLNVETEHSDEGKGIPILSECRVPDNGDPFPPGIVRHAVSFAKMNIGFGPIYVHCQMGGSRSPAFAYAILRWVHGMNPFAALEAVRNGKDWTLRNDDGKLVGGAGLTYGDHPTHRIYLASVEDALHF